MRLDLEEYDLIVEYLKGKDIFVKDALSRTTKTELKNVTQSKKKNSCAGEKLEDLSIQTLDASKPNLYDVISNDDVREVVALLITKNQCFFKHGKKMIEKIDVSDLYTKLKKKAVYTR